jgi:hypothetical protein
VFAVVGDVQVKIWGSWHDPTSQVKKFDRAHDYKTCKETFTLRHEMKLLVMTLNQDDCLILDLETMMHTPVSRGDEVVCGCFVPHISDVSSSVFVASSSSSPFPRMPHRCTSTVSISSSSSSPTKA